MRCEGVDSCVDWWGDCKLVSWVQIPGLSAGHRAEGSIITRVSIHHSMHRGGATLHRLASRSVALAPICRPIGPVRTRAHVIRRPHELFT